jgi:hypothetical protein
MDRHSLWRRVAYDVTALESKAPEGYEPSVEVFLHGRAAPVEIGFVETHRGPDDPWVRFQARSAKRSAGEERAPDEYWVHVHESMIARIEIRFIRKEEQRPTGFGFSYSDLPSDPVPSSGTENAPAV